MWDTSVGGHVDPGESIEEAMLREASEEAGLMDFEYHLAKKYIWQSEVERELVYTYLTTSDQLPVPDPVEVDEGRFWTRADIKAKLGKGVFTPNFEKEFSEILVEYPD
jgi:8-oxo-dGTP pyrophosphatase MutT (NUDIX family)